VDDRNRSYLTILQEAELLAMGPDAVADFLKSRAEAGHGETDHVYALTEERLRHRNHPRITLALARYAQYLSTVKPLFTLAPAASPVRLAILTNRAIAGDPFCLDSLFDGRDQAAAWLMRAFRAEIDALFENEAVSPDFWADVLVRHNAWADIGDATLQLVVAALSRNPGLLGGASAPAGSYAGRSWARFAGVAWSLARRLDTTPEWAGVLSRFLMRIADGPSEGPGDALEMVRRWVSDSPLIREEELEKNETGVLGDYQRMRCALGRQSLMHSPAILNRLLDDDDIALSMAAAMNGMLTAGQVRQLTDRGGPLAVFYLSHNGNVWAAPETRDALAAAAQDCVGPLEWVQHHHLSAGQKVCAERMVGG